MYRSIEDSTVIARDDGLYFVLVDFTNLVTTPDLAESGTANRYLGGTVEQPYFASFGSHLCTAGTMPTSSIRTTPNQAAAPDFAFGS